MSDGVVRYVVQRWHPSRRPGGPSDSYRQCMPDQPHPPEGVIWPGKHPRHRVCSPSPTPNLARSLRTQRCRRHQYTVRVKQNVELLFKLDLNFRRFETHFIYKTICLLRHIQGIPALPAGRSRDAHVRLLHQIRRYMTVGRSYRLAFRMRLREYAEPPKPQPVAGDR